MYPAVEKEQRQRICTVCERLYQKGLIAAGDGNVSVRVSDGQVLVTPSGFHKGFIRPADLCVADLSGRRLRGDHNPSSEFAMHALVYKERADVSSVVHAHPPFVVALALAGVPLVDCVLSETCLLLGPVPTASYSTPTTQEVPDSLRPFVRKANAIVMQRHGALTMGRTVEEAWQRMEALEHAAKIIHAARMLGEVTPLPARDTQKLEQLAEQLGIPRPPTAFAAPTHDADEHALIEAVLRKLGVRS
ncbi:MAG TPA: class II aldolase/adducin family protein [Pseudomonadota bacterium]|nr:class II aldolase/adducin family protein [Pseudomonadota bacterium]